MSALTAERSPGAKLGLALLVGFLLSFPLFTVWLLVYDRQQQSEYRPGLDRRGLGRPADHFRSPARHPLPRHRHRERDREQPPGDPHPHGLARAHPVARSGRPRHRGPPGAAPALDLRGRRLRRRGQRPRPLRHAARTCPRFDVAARRHRPRPRRAALRPVRSARPRRQSAGRRRRPAAAAAAGRRRRQPGLLRLARRAGRWPATR